ncbi:10908_t:CDS:2, partial [Gigaspora rosea]
DLSKGIKAEEIRAFLSYFGAQKEKSLKENWSLHLDHGKTYKTIPRKFNIAKLEERNRYRGTIFNIPTTAYDSLLLHQLEKYNVQAVYILNNRYGNQRQRAYVFFNLEKELLQAQKYNIYYYNTKLE